MVARGNASPRKGRHPVGVSAFFSFLQSGPHFSLLLVLAFLAALCLGIVSVLKLRHLQYKEIQDATLNPENAIRLAVDRYLRYFHIEQPIDSMDFMFANTMSVHSEIYHTKLARHNGFPEESLWEEEFFVGDTPEPESEVQHDQEVLINKLDDIIRQAHQVIPKQGNLAFASAAGHYGTLTKSLAKSRNQICKAIGLEDYETFDHRRRMLFLLGTQKGGTTFLFNAISRSKAYIGALHTYGGGCIDLPMGQPSTCKATGTAADWPKEVHFFNRFPQPHAPRREFLKSYPRATWLLDKRSEQKSNYTLVDATPDYMFNAMAPPRVKIMFPQAKFVVLLRDPVARSLSHYTMAKTVFCDRQITKYPNKTCDFPSFAEVIASELSVRQSEPACLFNRPGGSKSWADCFKCSFTALDSSVCSPDDGTDPPEPCSSQPYTIVDVGNYAAQLSWWMSFFTADRFKFVNSKELHVRDRGKQAAVLNSINNFVGLQTYTKFDAEMLRNVSDRHGPHDLDLLSIADKKALLALRLVYRQSLLDLGTIMRHNNVKFPGIPEEFSLAKLKEQMPKDILLARGGKAIPAVKPKHAVSSPPSPPPRDLPHPGTREYTDMQLDEIIARYNSTKANVSKYAYGQHTYGSLTRHDSEYMCPEIVDEAPYPVLSNKRKFLYILGTQKGGTTFLFSALSTHPGFVGAAHGFRQPHTMWAKEVHFFNRWPTPRNPRTMYMSCFPKETWMLGSNYSDYTLVDATPDYMFNAMAAPRMKEMVPQAKFVVLLRDPVTRAYSAYKMSQKMECRMQNKTHPELPCKFPSFAEVVVAESAARKTKKCLFDEPGSTKIWSDCFRCHFSHLSTEHCPKGAVNDGTLPAPCTAPTFITLDVGNYAAQLSWWFSFFPPERFLILLSSDLHDPDIKVRLGVLSKIKKFADIPGPEFEAEALEGARDFSGGYDLSQVHADDLRALLALRLIYRQSLVDLRLMLWKDGRHKDFPGITEEFTAANLRERMLLQQQFDRSITTPPANSSEQNASAHSVSSVPDVSTKLASSSLSDENADSTVAAVTSVQASVKHTPSDATKHEQVHSTLPDPDDTSVQASVEHTSSDATKSEQVNPTLLAHDDTVLR